MLLLQMTFHWGGMGMVRVQKLRITTQMNLMPYNRYFLWGRISRCHMQSSRIHKNLAREKYVYMSRGEIPVHSCSSVPCWCRIIFKLVHEDSYQIQKARCLPRSTQLLSERPMSVFRLHNFVKVFIVSKCI